jgi:selenocysteine-specific elongation factor
VNVQNIVVGTAGHIDHGKSALVEALTGVDPDRLQEEKDRGITIDLGFANYEQDDVNIAFVDVPGHERFVRNMLAGVSGIDAVLLVVAANESVMPQTREHFEICHLLGVKRGLVVLNKVDLVDAETLELVQLETQELLTGSFLEGAPIVPASAISGVGLDRVRTVLHGIAAAQESRVVSGMVRLPVDRVFSVKGFGTVVTGTLVSGEIHVDMELDVLPEGRRVKVRGLQVHGNREDMAVSGQRVAVNLVGMDFGAIRRGQTIVTPEGLDATRRFDATMRLLPGARALKHGARVRCHHGTVEAMARVSLSALTTESTKCSEPHFLSTLEPGDEAFVRVRLEEPIALSRGDRFVVRAYSPPFTIGGGEVLDPLPPSGRLRSRRGRDRLQRLSDAKNLRDSVTVITEESGAWGISRSALARRMGVTAEMIDKSIDSLASAGRVEIVGQFLIRSAVLKAARERLLGLVSQFHAVQPLEPGLPRGATREQFSHWMAEAVFEHVVLDLVTEGLLVATDYLALASHKMVLSPEEIEVCDRLTNSCFEAGLMPPDEKILSEQLTVAPDLVRRMIKRLIRDHVLVKVDDLVFHRERLEALRKAVKEIKVGAAGPVSIEIGMFKERFKITRKYAIPLLGYLDRERVTRRVGNARLVL